MRMICSTYHFAEKYPLSKTALSSRTTWTGTYAKDSTNRMKENISMPVVSFEPKTPALERAKTVLAIDNTVTVIGKKYI
jgi:hypothetical protein